MAWTILYPIEIYWRVAILNNSSLIPPDMGSNLACMIKDWLSEIPLPIDCLPDDPATLRIQLRDLRTNIARAPEARSVLGQLFLDKFRRQIPEIGPILAEEGFFSSSGSLQA